MALENRGWLRGEVWDGGVCCEMLRPLGEGQLAVLEFEDGIYLGALHESDQQTLGKVEVLCHGRPLAPGEVDEILMSELLSDLEGVR